MSKIDYDLKHIKGIAFDVDGVLSPSTIPLGQDGVPCRMVNIKDGYALQLAVKKGLKIAIISGARSEAVEIRFRALGINDIYMGASNKMPCLIDWLGKNGLKANEVAYAGDDIPDLGVMRHVGLSVAPRDADEFVKSVARYVTVANGGYGVAREILEEIMRAKGLWMSHADAFGW